MFEELHLCAWALARHLNAPFANERARYLSYCAERGDSQATLASKANRLIYGARQLSKCPELDVAIERLRTVSCGGKGSEYAWIQELNTRWSQKKFFGVARPWLRFLGWWSEPTVLEPFQEQLDEYRRSVSIVISVIPRRSLIQWQYSSSCSWKGSRTVGSDHQPRKRSQDRATPRNFFWLQRVLSS